MLSRLRSRQTFLSTRLVTCAMALALTVMSLPGAARAATQAAAAAQTAQATQATQAAPTAPAATKTGPVSIAYVEVNSNSMLNVGKYTLASNGANVFDIAVIFAANIDYDGTQATLYFNPQVQSVLDNVATQIKPLQQQGIKVELSILGNHQGAGFANFPSQTAAAAFAKQLSDAVTKYGLDGIDFDDEYADYGTNGTAQPNDSSFVYLVQALRADMPGKLITLYDIGPSASRLSYGGVDVSSDFDYSWNPYYGTFSVPGISLPKSHLGPAAIDFSATSASTATSLAQQTVSGGYGAYLTYNLTSTDIHDYISGFTNVLYGSSAVYGNSSPPPPNNQIVNGDFETGSLSGWTTSGASETVVSTGAHGGAYAAKLGASTATNGDSTAAQSFTVPTGQGQLSFWYNVTCPDSVSYDWATATLADATAGTSSTVLAKTCVATSGWTKVSAPVTAGHTYTLTLASHDDNYAGDPTYSLFDDVALSGSTPPPPNPVANGGFETGSLSSWTTTGTTGAVNTGAHGGTYAARLGGTAATNGDSTAAQTFTAPTGSTKVSFWYNVTCPDSVTYDWATATLKDNTANTTATALAKTCAASSGWTQVNTPVTAGHSYTLTLTSHDDNYAGDPTYTLYDDVTVS